MTFTSKRSAPSRDAPSSGTPVCGSPADTDNKPVSYLVSAQRALARCAPKRQAVADGTGNELLGTN